MVSSSILTFISRRLSEISDNNLPFGGYNVITVGDFFQLRPVKGNFAFENILLWRLFEPFFLTKNMRQNANATFFNLLNRVRFGLPSELDITILKSRLIRESTDYENMLHIFPLRKQVEQYNNHLFQKLAQISSVFQLHITFHNLIKMHWPLLIVIIFLLMTDLQEGCAIFCKLQLMQELC